MKLSVVSTLYRSGPHLALFYERMRRAVLDLEPDYEVVLVNDGCPDDSLAVALRLAAQDERVTVVDLSRNFGHHKAMMTGLAEARGERVFLIDCDLDPADIGSSSRVRRLVDLPVPFLLVGDEEGDRPVRIIGGFDGPPGVSSPFVVHDGTGFRWHADPASERVKGVGTKGPTQEPIALFELPHEGPTERIGPHSCFVVTPSSSTSNTNTGFETSSRLRTFGWSSPSLRWHQ
jgi:hypothetical protein